MNPLEGWSLILYRPTTIGELEIRAYSGYQTVYADVLYQGNSESLGRFSSVDDAIGFCNDFASRYCDPNVAMATCGSVNVDADGRYAPETGV